MKSFGIFLTTGLPDPILKRTFMLSSLLASIQTKDFLCNSVSSFIFLALRPQQYYRVMGRRNNDLRLSLRLPFLILITFLIVCPRLSSCRSIGRSIEGSHESPTAEYNSRFGHQFPAKTPGTTRDGDNEKGAETDPVYGVSKRTVPGGPNPLHN
ncbi:hypothetical protein CDL15_Pgr017893 [Punica granatum]|uniref:Uncharacterized protein n=1 Tax=Punica granatum TaxID=22663 RepID=A0A218WI13_PUNGR|nr:hypothetical protein CDL15_Pgr017893 [Punica granatum]